MTAATVAQPNGTAFAVLYVMVILVGFIAVVVLWSHERRGDRQDVRMDTHADQLAGLDYRLESLLEFLGVEVPEPVEDDSPEALQVYGGLAEVDKPDDAPTLPDIPVIPATEPSGIPIQVHGALIEARDLSGEFPHPVDSDSAKAKNAAWVEGELRKIRARIEAAQGVNR